MRLLVLTLIVGIAYPLTVWLVAQMPGLKDNADGSIIELNGRPVASVSSASPFTDGEGNPAPGCPEPALCRGAGYDPLSTGASISDPKASSTVRTKANLLTQVCSRSKAVGELEGADGKRPFCTGDGVGAVLAVIGPRDSRGNVTTPTRVVSVNQSCLTATRPFLDTYEGVRVECAKPGEDLSSDRSCRSSGPSRTRVPADAVTASGSGLDPISLAYADLQVARVAQAPGNPGHPQTRRRPPRAACWASWVSRPSMWFSSTSRSTRRSRPRVDRAVTGGRRDDEGVESVVPPRWSPAANRRQTPPRKRPAHRLTRPRIKEAAPHLPRCRARCRQDVRDARRAHRNSRRHRPGSRGGRDPRPQDRRTAPDGIEIINPRYIDYRGSRFPELDVPAVLARRPQVVLVDELAHQHARQQNPKRWMDVEELLDAGISVISTVNVQHLEPSTTSSRRSPESNSRRRFPTTSSADRPDRTGRHHAGSTAAQTLHGNVYAAEKVDAALSNYFRRGNLTALRGWPSLAPLDQGRRRTREIPRRQQNHRHLGGPRTGRGRGHRRPRIQRRWFGGPHGSPRESSAELMIVHVVRGDGLSGFRHPRWARCGISHPASAQPCTPSSVTTCPKNAARLRP